MPDARTERDKPRPTATASMWAGDAAALRVAWAWWGILLANMAVFAWGLRLTLDWFSFLLHACVWLGAFSCCMIFHLEGIKRTSALRAEVEELRRELEDRTEPHASLMRSHDRPGSS